MESTGPYIPEGLHVGKQTNTSTSHSHKTPRSLSQLGREISRAGPNCYNTPHSDKPSLIRDIDSCKDKNNYKKRRTTRWEQNPEKRKAPDGCYSDTPVTPRDSRNIGSGYTPTKAVIGASGTEIIGYKREPPTNTIMIKQLAAHVNEYDIRQAIIHDGLVPKDIRLIRRSLTGASRGFAFVEFSTLADAKRWMDINQGVLTLEGQYRAFMQYSIPKGRKMDSSPTSDWFCIKCSKQNFKRRVLCFQCGTSRIEGEVGGMGIDEISNYITKTIMIRNLDTLTTEDSVLQELQTHVPDKVQTISGVFIGRDALTSTSRGICYLGMNSTVDSSNLYGTLTSLIPPLSIDGKTVILSYCKYHMGDQAKSYDVDKHSASHFASNNYYTEQITDGNLFTLSEDSPMDTTNSATALAQAAIQKVCAKKSAHTSAIPNGIDRKLYPIPDPTKFSYEKSTGYFYDSSTFLYYDAGSGYFWNSVIQKYLFYDPVKFTYLLAPDVSSKHTDQQQPAEVTTIKEQKSEKEKPLKAARKIVKDMERWAKTLNQEKESLTSHSSKEGSLGSCLADAGYAVLRQEESGAGNIVYRDRAKERRRKYGYTEEVPTDRLKQTFLESVELLHVPGVASVAEGIGVENVGNRLLQKMGWTEGQGLGKLNQGATTIIEAKQHMGTVGLGNSAYSNNNNEPYKNCVKKVTIARYQALTDKI